MTNAPTPTRGRGVERVVWGVIGLTIAGILVAYIRQEGGSDGTSQAGGHESPGHARGVSASSGGTLPVLFAVPDFLLTNQANRTVSRGDLEGTVWIADIIFTRCAGPCPEMTRRMAEVQAIIPAQDPVKFVTLTTDPEYDTPGVLNAYGRRFQADPARWFFLTGTKKQIFDLAVRGLKLTALAKEEEEQQDPNDLFVHSTLFVVVDQQGRVRQILESDAPDMKPRLIDAIGRLLNPE